MFLFSIIGLIVMLAPFLSDQVKAKTKATKVTVYTTFFVVGSLFTYIGANSIYETYFSAYPSMAIDTYAKERFDAYNVVAEKFQGEEVIDVEKESTYLSCEDDYCAENSDK